MNKKSIKLPMKNLSNKTAFLIVFILAGALVLFNEFSTRGFKANKIVYRGPFVKDFKFEGGIDDKILSQTFTFLNQGRQSFVFQSEDRQYILKFMRANRYQPTIWSHFLPMTHYRKQFYERKNFRLENVIQSYRLATFTIPEISDVVYAHFNFDNSLQKKVAITHRIGLKQVINLDEMAFVVQRKATLLKEMFLKNINNPEKIQKLILSFFQKLNYRLEKGIINHDKQNYPINIGYTDDQFVEFDIGSFRKGSDSGEILQNFESCTQSFRSFLQEEYPDHLSFFDKNLQVFLSKLKSNL